MSELITIAKSRKTGKWEILASPDDSFDVHNNIYRKLIATLPVNDEYEKLVPSRIQPFLTCRTFITSGENKTRLEAQASLADRAKNAGTDADARQKLIDEANRARIVDLHEAALDEKNALVNKIRDDTGQPKFDTTKTEAAAAQFAERLKSEDPTRPSDVLRVKQAQASSDAKALAAVPKTHTELLAEKNALVDKTKQQAQDISQQQEQAQADKQARVDTKKQSSAKT
jgi:hypothetical protein